MTTSAERIRAWNGPAILTFGFRPFFLAGAIWAALAMVLWVAMLAGRDVLPTAFDPVSWHAHEMLFGYLGAVMAGFLLTAVPNWTGSLPISGWPLLGLALLWGLGRADVLVLALTLVALTVWVFWPDQSVTAVVCGLAGLAHLWRLARWQGVQPGAEALVWVLHAGYAFVPIGFLAVAAGAMLPGLAPAAQHLWMAGAVGLMTLAIMTRASLGHAGRPLHATRPVSALYLALILSVAARFAAGVLIGQDWLLHLAAAAWILAFGGFAAIYWPILTQPKSAPRRPSGAEPTRR